MKLLKMAGLSLVLALSACSGGDWLDLSGSFDGWEQVGDANWRLEGDEFVADEGQGFLVTEEEFQDFEIDLEYWTDEPANSGIYMRIEDRANVTDTSAYEANIFDTRPDQTYATGALVYIAPPSEPMMGADQWNEYNIKIEGDHIVITLNGVTTVDVHDDTFTEAGPIGLQAFAGTVKFRNVRIRSL